MLVKVHTGIDIHTSIIKRPYPMQQIRHTLLYCTLLLLNSPYYPLAAIETVPEPILTAAPRSTTAHIIFDLGGVLIDTKKSRFLWRLGPKRLALYWLFTSKSPRALKHTLYTIMNSVERQYNNTPQSYDDTGLPLPSIMHSWLSGKETNAQILEKLTQAIAQHPEWFVNHTEQSIMQKMVKIIFTPKKFVATRTFISKGIKLVKACKERGFKVYILSNWDTESFNLLRAQNPSIFNLFDGIIISGDHKCLKPNRQLYQILLSTFNLHPLDCVMIDDRIENIQAARTLDIHGIHCTGDFNAIEKEILAWVRYTAQETNSRMICTA